MTLTYGVHSEAGQLRRVMVHRPGSEMARLTPANAASLLFDDVLWVKQARIDHMALVDVLRKRVVEVVMLRQLLEEVLHYPEAPRWNSGSTTIQWGWDCPPTCWPALWKCPPNPCRTS